MELSPLWGELSLNLGGINKCKQRHEWHEWTILSTHFSLIAPPLHHWHIGGMEGYNKSVVVVEEKEGRQ